MTNPYTRTAKFYAANTWPGPDAIVSRKWATRLAPYIQSKDFTFLDAGCGSGQYTAGMLLEYPGAKATAIDISEPSLDDARQIMRREGLGDRVEIDCRSFSEPLGWDNQFDFAIANGSIHHSPDLKQSMINIAAALKPGGVLGCMIYGSRSNARRYEIKEILHTLGGGDDDEMYDLYVAYKKKYASILDRTPRVLIRQAKHWVGRRIAKITGREQYWGYESHRDGRRLFVDGYVTPLDVAISSRGLKELLDAAGLELCEMFTMGRPDKSILPQAWIEPWERLSEWEKIRVCEIVTPHPMGFSFAARKTA
jgi:SAM-dependent methyltransferase